MGRAIIAEAPVCLMDEPMSNLDAKLRNEMRAEIQQLQRQLGITMLYVTHDQVEAMSMADQVVLLNAGRIEQVAPPEVMYSRPAGIFTARFVGQPPMNLMRLASTPQGAAIAGSGGTAVIPQATADMLAGVRPEDMVVSDAAASQRPCSRASTWAPTPFCVARWATEELLVRAGSHADPVGGSTRNLSWPADALHLFDGKSGRRLGSEA